LDANVEEDFADSVCIIIAIAIIFALICLSARTTTPKKFLLLFYRPFHAQEALEISLKLQNVSRE